MFASIIFDSKLAFQPKDSLEENLLLNDLCQKERKREITLTTLEPFGCLILLYLFFFFFVVF